MAKAEAQKRALTISFFMLNLPKPSLASAHLVITPSPNGPTLYANDIIMRRMASQGHRRGLGFFGRAAGRAALHENRIEDQVLFVIFPAKIRANFTIAL